MKREELLAIINDSEKTAEEKRDAIMALNGADITRERDKAAKLEERITSLEGDIVTANEAAGKHSDYDAVVKERDELLAEKADRGMQDRFAAVLGGQKPKNEYTKAGLYAAFKEALASEESKDKTDADILAGIVGDKSGELFENPVRISMSGVNPNVNAGTDDVKAYMDEMYKNNPFYSPTN